MSPTGRRVAGATVGSRFSAADVHRRSGIGLRAPNSVHYSLAQEVCARLAVTLDGADAARARFPHRRPTPPKLPERCLDQQADDREDTQKKS